MSGPGLTPEEKAELAVLVDVAARRIVETHEAGLRRTKLFDLRAVLNRAAAEFGPVSGAWMGCALELVRAACLDSTITTSCTVDVDGDRCWSISGWETGRFYSVSTYSEGEALLAALDTRARLEASR